MTSPTPPPGSSPWWRPPTLSRQLVLGVSAVVVVAVLAVGALAVEVLRGFGTAVGDAEVRHSLAAFGNALDERRADAGGGNGRATVPLTGLTGQAPGTIIAVVRDGRVEQSAMFDDIGPHQVPGDALDALVVGQPGNAARTVDLGRLGHYRVAGADTAVPGRRLLSAVSLRGVEQTVAARTLAIGAVALVAAVLAAVGTITLVRRALRPLRRVAGIAAAAATLPLAGEDQRITARVRRADSNPDSEVGIVGETLNRLLANVDSALAARAAADRRMRRFLTEASHELRTPLTAIQGYAELTRQDGPGLPETTEYALARIESESRRMGTLVTDMLLLARLDEGGELDVAPVDLNALVADAVNDVAVTARTHHFAVELPPETVTVAGDGARLQQVLTNLLANARNHTPPGVTVTTSLERFREESGDWVRIHVTDDGPGIAAELVPEIFGRFVRTGAPREGVQSSGLGLAIVRSITEAHGGTVDVQSRPGRTEFRVLLPVDGPDRHADEGAEGADLAAAQDGRGTAVPASGSGAFL